MSAAKSYIQNMKTACRARPVLLCIISSLQPSPYQSFSLLTLFSPLLPPSPLSSSVTLPPFLPRPLNQKSLVIFHIGIYKSTEKQSSIITKWLSKIWPSFMLPESGYNRDRSMESHPDISLQRKIQFLQTKAREWTIWASDWFNWINPMPN